jgi:hypothetical protein
MPRYRRLAIYALASLLAAPALIFISQSHADAAPNAGAVSIARSASIARGESNAQAGSRVKIAWGINRRYWNSFKHKVPLAKAVRVYYDTVNDFPSTWPQRAGKGVWVTLSIRPRPSDLLSGKLDKRLKTLIDSAPPNSNLAVWHENYPGNPLGYPHSVNNPRTAVAMQKYMERLVKGSNVRFGVIISGPAIQEMKWIARGLDWYGVDLFDNKRYWDRDKTLNKQKLWTRMTNNLIAFKKVSGQSHPLIQLDETNTPWDNHRRHWFMWISQWFATHNNQMPARIITYWNPKAGHASGGLSGPWPPSPQVVNILRLLSEAFS